jgi:hypothetical protein
MKYEIWNIKCGVFRVGTIQEIYASLRKHESNGRSKVIILFHKKKEKKRKMDRLDGWMVGWFEFNVQNNPRKT